ncbi:MAG: bifunctional molybdenum cofactor biosynthesis protein MoaC/MoaB [Synergistaceae bacterium]|nr:bifunctional molybdenum cofactor biosynthesis protein MoaC/MoaB [Synergistaceae bacterium]
MKSTHLDDSGRPVMVDVSSKEATVRIAEAEGIVRLTPEICGAIRTNSISKGDVFRVAELAGIMAAKRTYDIIPLCHSIRLNHVKVTCSLDDDSNCARVNCTVKASEVTGVEMEALTGASVSCLTIYDMCKSMDKGIIIEEIRLLSKSGGKSGDYDARNHIKMKDDNGHQAANGRDNSNKKIVSSGILTISDKGSRGERSDTSGEKLADLLKSFGADVKRRAIVPDEKTHIAEKLIEWSDEDNLELIVTTGGTGLSPRDVTPEALLEVGDRIVPGIGESMRMKSLSQTPNGILSRGIAVTRGKTLIIALPGSERGSSSCFEAVEPALRHAIEILNGWESECGTKTVRS